MTQKFFGTDGIRGRANAFPMTADIALKVAMAGAIALKRGRKGKQTNRAVIGKDTRLSCYMLEQAMTAGFLSMGIEVILTGPIPTPGISMLTRSLRADLGVMISASHNGFEDNGIKLFGADGYKLEDSMEAEIEALLREGDLSAHLAAPDALGKASRLDDCLGRYSEFVKQSFPKNLSLDGLKVVVDCANGAAYRVAPQTLWELEAEVIAIGVAPNGRNINDGCGATDTTDLQKAVLEHKADVGIALDGDADRLIMVDEAGRKIDGDQLMAALAVALQEKGQLEDDTVVATVMSNLGLERFLGSKGIALHRTAVGDRYVSEAMRKGGYNLGGEQSGHIVLSDYSTTGDGLLAALQLLAVLKQKGQKASVALNCFTPAPQILKNVRYQTGKPMELPEVQSAIKTAEARLVGSGRLLVRPSGTETLIRVMAEGDNHSLIEDVVDDVCGVIERAAKTA